MDRKRTTITAMNRQTKRTTLRPTSIIGTMEKRKDKKKLEKKSGGILGLQKEREKEGNWYKWVNE